MTTAKCNNFCHQKEFILKYDIKKALGRAYSKIRPRKNDIKRYLEGYRRCSVCEIYFTNVDEDDFKCVCCGWIVRTVRRNVRGKLIQERYSNYTNKKSKMKNVPLKDDILSHKEQWEAILVHQ